MALALGGGPKATTIELAIYQSLRFDFNFAKAAQLGITQFSLCAILGIMTVLFSKPVQFSSGLDIKIERWDRTHFRYLLFDIFILTFVCLFLFLPLLSIFIRGIIPIFSLPNTVWIAAFNSVLVAIVSSIISIEALSSPTI